MTKSGPKTKESRGERRYVKRAITLSPEVDDYVLSHREDGQSYSSLIDRLIREHQALVFINPKLAEEIESVVEANHETD